jgi:outer membrane protein OmpA-like peptidoglycan-associated protein
MADNPDTEIEIIGYADRISENGNCGIAIRRAQAVKDYLTERFGINESRIVVKDNGDICYPENETRTQSEQGFAENRRVEITSDQADRVFAVNRVSFSDPVRLSPEKLAITADVYTETTYQGDTRRKNDATWKLILGQNGQIILERDGFGNPEEQIIDLDRNIVSGLTEGKIDIELMGEYKYFKEQDAVEIEIVKDTLENEVQTLQLALFDVSSSRLSSDVKQSLRSFLSNLSDSAEITVSGYSDNLGDSESNKELSQVRAEAVARAIRDIAPQVQIKSIEGYGSTRYPPGMNSYTSPEERFISRTVQIEIINKR